jgi:oligopeptide transport system substrate-binding protein
MKRLFALGGAVLLAAVLSGCGPEKAVRAPCPAGKVCLEMGIGAEVNSIDPNKITASWEDQVVGDLMIGLVQSDMNGKPTPGMATHWDVSPDGLKWTFHLRNAKWSDGAPVTADDFVFSLQRILKPETASEFAALLYVFKNAEAVNQGKAPSSAVGVRATNAKTVEYTLEHPAPYLLELAMHQTMYPVPKHVVEKLGDQWLRPGSYVSNGPYKLVSWKLGDRIVAVKNPLFWDADQVCIDRVSYYPTEDRTSGERQVKSGSLDTHTPLNPNRIAFLRTDMPGYVRTAPMLGTTYFAFNTNLPKFQDKRVRQALSMSIDREFITGKVRNNGEPPAYTFVPPGIANYTPPPPPAWAAWPYEKRVAEAKRLLAAAGYGPKRPLRFEFTFRGYDPTGMYAAVQADWRKMGVEATLLATETQIAYQQLRIRDFEVGDVAWVADYNDAMNFLYLLQSKTGGMNYSDYNNPAYDALLAQADNERDVIKRAAIMRRAEKLMLDDFVIIPFYSYVTSSVTNPRVTGFASNVVDKHRIRYMCFADVKR